MDLEAFKRLFADYCHKTATARQDETLGVAEDSYQLLHAWRPTAPPDEEFRRVSRAGVPTEQGRHADEGRRTRSFAASPARCWPTPKEAEVYGDDLNKLRAQEKEMGALTDKQKKPMDAEFKARKANEDILGNYSD